MGAAFMRDNRLQSGQRYPMTIQDLPDSELYGTLDRSGFIGGLSLLYREFALQVGDELDITYDGSAIHITPPSNRRVRPNSEISQPAGADGNLRPVFERQNLRHMHIEPYAPGNLGNWQPQTEVDVYMVFGALSEYTDYRYCCGVSQTLIDALGYRAATRPDAFLIERATGQYIVAEFKMNSRSFALNHSKEDVDVLICWEDDEPDRSKLPPQVLGLRALRERAVKEGEIDI